MVKARYVLLFMMAFAAFACNEEHAGERRVADNAKDAVKAPRVSTVNRGSLRVITPGSDGVPLPEKVQAIHSNSNPYYGPGPVIPGKSRLPLTAKEFNSNGDVEFSKPPTVVTAGKQQVVRLLKKKPPQDGGKNCAKPINPATGKPLHPPEIIEVKQSGDTAETTKSPGNSLNTSPEIVPATRPDIIKASRPHYKTKSTQNIRYMDVEEGLPSSYVLKIFEDHEKHLWFGISDGLIRYDGETFQHFTTANGITDNYIMAAAKDSKDNLWFGSYFKGISKYDGATFTNYTKAQGLTDNRVYALTTDSSDNLWIGTKSGGVSKFNGKTFTNYTTRQGLTNNHVLSIFEDSQANMWFGTLGGGVVKFNGSSFVQITRETGLSSNKILAIFEDSHGNMWFGTDGGGVNRYDGNNFTHYTTLQGLCDNRITSISEDPQGNLWFGSWGGGLSKYNGRAFTSYTTKDGLSKNHIRDMYHDAQGNLWIGTEGGGVNEFHRNPFRHYTTTEGLSNNIVLAIAEDAQSNLWLGTWGGGLTKFNGKNFTHYTTDEGLSSNFVRSLIIDQNENIWIGTRGGGVSKFNGDTFTHYTTANGLSHDSILSVCEDQSGNIWFGTYEGGISMFDGESFIDFTREAHLGDSRVFSILEDSDGNLWFGTYGNGISKYNGETFTHYTTRQGLASNQITTLYEDSEGDIWIGTHGSGVTRYNGRKFVQYTTKDGLSHNIVYSIKEDQDKNLWLSTENGISLLTRYSRFKMEKPVQQERYKFYELNKQDGLKGLNFFANAACIDSENRIWWGSGKSLTSLNLEIFQLPQTPPDMQLKHIEIEQQYIDYRTLLRSKDTIAARQAIAKPMQATSETVEKLKDIRFTGVTPYYNYPRNLELPWDLNHLSFYFAAIDWSAPHKIRYSYKLEGLEENWSRTMADTKADYRNIPYGEYTFKVRAIGMAGKWSEPLSYHFIIHPPWWHTWWAHTLFAVILVSLIALLLWWRTRSLKKRQKELEQTVKERTHEIRLKNSKLNKHKEEIQAQAEYLKDLVEELNSKNQRLEEMNDEKNNMMRFVAHDLKRPLNTVFVFSKLIEEGQEAFSEEQQEYLDIIYKEVEEGNNLIQDLLDIHAIEAYQTKMNYTQDNLFALIEELLQTHKTHAHKKNIAINFQSDAREVWCYTDSNYLQRILDNLISNAIKFSPFNRNIWITLLEKKHTIYIAIQDEGPGFSDEDKAHLYKKFQKLSARPTNEEPSSGLGLSIVKTLLNRLQGDIELYSEKDSGSTFTIKVPKHGHEVKK